MSDEGIRTSVEEDVMKYKYKVYCHNCREKNVRWFDLGNSKQELFCDGCKKRCVVLNKGNGYDAPFEIYLKVDENASECEFSLKELN